MICEKDLFNRLICLFSIKETFVTLSENIDIIELCYMLGETIFVYLQWIRKKIIVGNLVALASIDFSQIESMKQPFVDSLFNILDTCRQRQIHDEQNGKQSKTTSIWHPILGHIRGKSHTITVFVDFFHFSLRKILFFRSNQEIVQRVILQYKYLWSKSFVHMLFESIPSGNVSSTTMKKETSKRRI